MPVPLGPECPTVVSGPPSVWIGPPPMAAVPSTDSHVFRVAIDHRKCLVKAFLP